MTKNTESSTSRCIIRTWSGTSLGAGSVINLSDLPKPQLPSWSKGRVIVDARTPTRFETDKLIATLMKGHPKRMTSTHLSALVGIYEIGKDASHKTYQARPDDPVNGCCGLKELLLLEQGWLTLPASFREWARDRLFFGPRDILRHVDGSLLVPCLSCVAVAGQPRVTWYAPIAGLTECQHVLRIQD